MGVYCASRLVISALWGCVCVINGAISKRYCTPEVTGIWLTPKALAASQPALLHNKEAVHDAQASPAISVTKHQTWSSY